ncbi:hypothetical protein AB0N62_39505 [Streptomyces sp. NPDC093982]|uniref:hypothetical protein n=1 Tax=Streptomyces sp. NPDC093982 TaxID=3155077 RepID=UPI003424750D
MTGEGTTTSPILGPVLHGGEFAALPDTDRGTLDGNTAWDRAVGPMQFIPSTWRRWATSTRPAGFSDPNNIFDATTTAAAYLCANNRDLNDPEQLNQAILSYNPSHRYLQDVLAWNSRYASGVSEVPASPFGSTTPDSNSDGSKTLARPASTSNVVRVTLPKSRPPVRSIHPTNNSGSTQEETASQPTTADESQNPPEQVSAPGAGVHVASGLPSADVAVVDESQGSDSGADVDEAAGLPSADVAVVDESQGSDSGADVDEAAELPSAGGSAAPCASGETHTAGAVAAGLPSADVAVVDESQGSDSGADVDEATELPPAGESAVTCASGETQVSDSGASADAEGESACADTPAAVLPLGTTEINGAVTQLGRPR